MADIDGGLLLPVARAAIAEGVGVPLLPPPLPAWAEESGAAFVTLTKDGKLRGCIGTLEAHRPLIDDVIANARNAAFHDPRFRPVTRDELDALTIEVSVLSAPEELRFTGRADAYAQLRPGVDGVILRYRHHRGTFLPQVWEQLPTVEQFMAHLNRKAGLPDDFWPEPDARDRLHLSRYTVTAWSE